MFEWLKKKKEKKKIKPHRSKNRKKNLSTSYKHTRIYTHAYTHTRACITITFNRWTNAKWWRQVGYSCNCILDKSKPFSKKQWSSGSIRTYPGFFLRGQKAVAQQASHLLNKSHAFLPSLIVVVIQSIAFKKRPCFCTNSGRIFLKKREAFPRLVVSFV